MPRLLLALILVAACLLGAPHRASAQGVVGLGSLPTSTTPPSSADEATIAAYVAAQASGLTGDDAAVKSARDMLLRPIAQPGVTEPFRRAYAKALGPVLTTAFASDKDLHRANTMRIAGEVAASTLVQFLVDGLKDKSSSVRYAAAFGIARLFEASNRSDPAVSTQRMGEIISALASVVKSEADPLVLDGAVLGFKAALDLEPERLRDPSWSFRNASLVSFANALGARIAALSGEQKAADKLPVALRGLVVVREMVQIMVSKAGGFPADPKSAIKNACKAILDAEPALRKSVGPAGTEGVDAVKAATDTISKLTAG
jgi:hypothetical protein